METDEFRRRRFEAVVAEVYEPLQRYLGRRALPEDVAEVLNDTLLVVWRRLDDVPAGDALPWSYGVARRCLANHRRGDRRRLRLVHRVGTTEAPRVAVDGAAGHPELEAAMATLDEAERELVRLWAWEQLEPREIALALDTTANAVSVRLTRVKKKLASAMARKSAAVAGQEAGGHRREPGP